MTGNPVHRTLHRKVVDSSAGVLYGIIADALRWPIFFPHHIHVEELDFDGRRQRLRTWVNTHGVVRSWTLIRTLDPDHLSVGFRLEVPAEPMNAVVGSWRVEPLGAERAQVTLRHHFLMAGDAAQDVELARQVAAAHSDDELTALQRLAEGWKGLEDLVLSCEDWIRVKAPTERVYDFLYRAGRWPSRVPHIHSVRLRERQPGIQMMDVDILAPNGTMVTSQSVRLGFPHAGRIVYKDTQMPEVMASHIGEWSIEPEPEGTRLIAQHHVVLRAESVERARSQGTDPETIRRRVRERLGRSSVAAMSHAKKYAESPGRAV